MQASAIYDAADSVIAQRLSQVEGVADVTVAGSEQPAVRVRVDPTRLASMGVSLEDVRTAIANANALGPLGSFDGARQRAITIGINDQLRDAADYNAARGEDGRTAPSSACPTSPRSARRAQQPLRRLVQPRARRCC